MRPGVFIAMPAYRGADVIEESIRSIRAQTFEDFHLVISIDGAEDPTIEPCAKYTDDPRIEVVVQESRLGWPGNFNWLVRQCDREFFCYWQQDDLASTRYLENLRRELLARPDAAIAYTDVQWFGASFDRTSTPGIEGDPLSRVMQHIEAIRYEPLRGLIRASMLPQRPDAIPVTEDESCQEEFVFMAELAAAGNFVRIDSAMYFKRLHHDNAFVRWAQFPDWRRRRGWISMGAGMYRIARDLAPRDLHPAIVAQVVDRLAVQRHGRAHFYLPPQIASECHRFARDFVAFAGVTAEELAVPITDADPLRRPVDEEVRIGLMKELEAAYTRLDLADRIQKTGLLHIDMTDAIGGSLLGYGWSNLESWGVWTDGGEATLRVPSVSGSDMHISLTGQVYGDRVPIHIGIDTAEGEVKYHDLVSRGPVALATALRAGQDEIVLDLPDTRSPASDGLSADDRHLGFGLHRVSIEVM